jgi:BASS family bile acid:Na+ symporter
MNEVLLSLSRLAMLIFLLASMLGVGLSMTVSQIVTPLKSLRLVATALLANFVIVPLVAVACVKLFRLDEPFAIGLLLLGLAPGAPFLPKLAEVAKGDVAFAVALMALLMAGTVVLLPIALPWLSPGAKVSAWQIGRPLLLLMVLPLIVGLVFKARLGSFTQQLRFALSWVSNASLLLVLVLVVVLNLPGVLKVFGTGAIAACMLFTIMAGLAGLLSVGAGIATRKVMVLGTGFRNLAAALVVGEEDFKDPQVTIMLVIAGLVGLFVLMPITLAWGKHPLTDASLASRTSSS